MAWKTYESQKGEATLSTFGYKVSIYADPYYGNQRPKWIVFAEFNSVHLFATMYLPRNRLNAFNNSKICAKIDDIFSAKNSNFSLKPDMFNYHRVVSLHKMGPHFI